MIVKKINEANILQKVKQIGVHDEFLSRLVNTIGKYNVIVWSDCSNICKVEDVYDIEYDGEVLPFSKLIENVIMFCQYNDCKFSIEYNAYDNGYSIDFFDNYGNTLKSVGGQNIVPYINFYVLNDASDTQRAIDNAIKQSDNFGGFGK